MPISKPPFRGAAARLSLERLENLVFVVVALFFLTAVPVLWLAPVWAEREYEGLLRGHEQGQPLAARKPDGATISVQSAEAASRISDVVKLTSDIRDIAFKFYAGFGALIAGFFTIRTYRLSVRTRRSESFIKAIDQIGSEDVLERVGGIYGLGILLRAADPRDDYWRLMDILSAIVRRYAPRKDGPSPEYISLDVEAALNVIGRRRTVIQRDEPDASTDLNSTDLSNAYLVGMRFEWAYFGYAILNGANLRDAYLNAADFNGAEMKQAQLHGADLTEANISQDQVDSASGNRQTKLPKHVNRPAHWNQGPKL